jgi:hypothetical protein
MTEEEEKKQLIEDFPDLYLSVRVEERTSRSKRLKVRGIVEICPGEEDDNWDMVSVTGKNRYSYARQICNMLSRDKKRHRELLAKVEGEK